MKSTQRNKPVKVWVVMLQFFGADGRVTGAHPVHVCFSEAKAREMCGHDTAFEGWTVEECWTMGIAALQEEIYSIIEKGDS